MGDSEQTVNVSLGHAEALVLFELLADFYSQSSLQIPGPAERLALVRLQGALEKALVEPFMPNYRELIEEARSKLAIQYGS